MDQRLLPRIAEGEVRMLMVTNALFQIIHKKPIEGGFSAVGGVNIPTFYAPSDPKYASLRTKFIETDIPQLMEAMHLGTCAVYRAARSANIPRLTYILCVRLVALGSQPLPLIWTGDFIPADGPVGDDGVTPTTVYIVGEFNCSCVGLTNFGKGCGPNKDVDDVSDDNYHEGETGVKIPRD